MNRKPSTPKFRDIVREVAPKPRLRDRLAKWAENPKDTEPVRAYVAYEPKRSFRERQSNIW